MPLDVTSYYIRYENLGDAANNNNSNKYLETIPGQHSIDSLQKLPY
jgi:hypothetical protein